MTEHDIQNQIRVRVSKYGVIFRINVGKGYTPDGRYFSTGLPPGFPDLHAVINGRAVYIEVKKPGENPTIVQEKMHRILRKHGAAVEVCHSADEAENFIKKEVLKNGIQH